MRISLDLIASTTLGGALLGVCFRGFLGLQLLLAELVQECIGRLDGVFLRYLRIFDLLGLLSELVAWIFAVELLLRVSREAPLIESVLLVDDIWVIVAIMHLDRIQVIQVYRGMHAVL